MRYAHTPAVEIAQNEAGRKLVPPLVERGRWYFHYCQRLVDHMDAVDGSALTVCPEQVGHAD